MARSHEIDMCSGAIFPKLMQVAIPLACSGILQLFFNAADIIVVGRYAGDNSLAAVSSNVSLVALLTNFFLGLSAGANILAARYFGSRDEQGLSKTVHTAITISLVSGVILTLIGVFGARTILIWMQCPENVLPLATLYLRIYFGGMTATMLYNFGAALLRAQGDTKRPLYYLTFAGVVNVALNLFFVIKLHMDVAGVAIATVISQIISAILVLRCLMREAGPMRLELGSLGIDTGKLRQILQVGIPAGLQGVLFSVSNVVIQSSINSFGEVVMAGNGAAFNIENFLYAPIEAFYQTNAAFASQNYGAGNHRRILPIYIQAQVSNAVLTAALSALVYFFGPQLLSIYTDSPAVIEAGMVRIAIVCITYALNSFMNVIVGTIRGIGYNVMPMVVTLLGACAFRLVWIATVFQIPRFHTIETIYWSYPVSWVITYLAHLICLVIVYRKLSKRADGQAEK